MEKMNGNSMDLVSDNLAQLKHIFPGAFSADGKIDFDALKGLLGDAVDTSKEHYRFTWNGKEESRAFALRPSRGTLRPCTEKSVGKKGEKVKFDSENLYIEGDNLEVLKLLQGPYHGKVKMIYIDPPYNTGHDFVYADDFKDSIENYKAVTGQTDGEGNAVRANPETSGRYHTDWLNMMFPRLVLARNLLKDDGVIFISIDDNEVTNARKLCDEVFGEGQFLTCITRATGTPTGGGFEGLVNELDYVLAYARDVAKTKIYGMPMTEEDAKIYDRVDSDGKRYLVRSLRRTGGEDRREDRPTMYFPIVAPDGSSVYPTGPTGYESRWICSHEKVDELIKSGLLEWGKITRNGKQEWHPFQKYYLENRTKAPGNLWTEIEGNKKATREIRDIFEESKVFDFPKPVDFLKKTLLIGSSNNDLILDFFSGSATTAHAVMQLNAEDGGNRKFIMVQLPEPCAADSEAAKAGYKNICEIGEERIRRAGAKIKDANPMFAGDTGFKCFKLDTSNLIPWNPNPEDLEHSLLAAVDNCLADRTLDDVLYEVLLKCNLPLTLPVEKRTFGDNTIAVIGEGALMICLDKQFPITAAVAEEMVRLRDQVYKPEVPMQVVFLDSGFTDKEKANAIATLTQAGISEQSILSI